MGRSKNKTPKVAHLPSPKKEAKIASEPPNFRGGVLTWRLNAVDREGPFSWNGLQERNDFKEVVEKLANFETMSENEIRDSGSHPIEVGKLSKSARNRLIELELDDLDTVFSFRIMGKRRVIAVQRQRYMRLLWWDPEHQVCPSLKKHT